MGAPEEPPSDDAGWRSLLATPERVVRYLQSEPLLLAGMGAAVLLAIVAIFAAPPAATYAWLIAGVVFGASLLWLVAAAIRGLRQQLWRCAGLSTNPESCSGSGHFVLSSSATTTHHSLVSAPNDSELMVSSVPLGNRA